VKILIDGQNIGIISYLNFSLTSVKYDDNICIKPCHEKVFESKKDINNIITQLLKTRYDKLLQLFIFNSLSLTLTSVKYNLIIYII
jgi:hypothetical protein